MEDLKKSYINAMRGVTSTVSIISAKSDGERHAMTATSVTSLSLDPPAMLVCVNKDASIPVSYTHLTLPTIDPV